MHLVENLRYLRKMKGKLQQEIAIPLGVDQKTISSWERGTRTPTIEAIIKLARYYGVSLDDLVLKKMKPLVPMYARNLQYLRKKHGIKQIELAHLLGLKTESAYSKIENARIEPQIGKLRELADFFGVTMDQIVKQDLSQEVSK